MPFINTPRFRLAVFHVVSWGFMKITSFNGKRWIPNTHNFNRYKRRMAIEINDTTSCLSRYNLFLDSLTIGLEKYSVDFVIKTGMASSQ